MPLIGNGEGHFLHHWLSKFSADYRPDMTHVPSAILAVKIAAQKKNVPILFAS